MVTVGMAISTLVLSTPTHVPHDERKEVLAPQPMLFTVQYILSTLLRIPSTWENSHSFSSPNLSRPSSRPSLPVATTPSFSSHRAFFPSRSFSRLFLSTALNLLSVLSNKVYGSAGVDLYRGKRKKRRGRGKEPCAHDYVATEGAIAAAFRAFELQLNPKTLKVHREFYTNQSRDILGGKPNVYARFSMIASSREDTPTRFAIKRHFLLFLSKTVHLSRLDREHVGKTKGTLQLSPQIVSSRRAMCDKTSISKIEWQR